MKKRQYKVRVSVDHVVTVTATSANEAEHEALVEVSKLHGDDLDLMHVTNVTQLPTNAGGEIV